MCYGEALSAAVVRARKKHGCGDCGRAIEPGRPYLREAGTFEGEFYAAKRCRTCAAEVRALLDEIPSGECLYLSGEERDSLRSRPWRETLSRLRAAWATLKAKP